MTTKIVIPTVDTSLFYTNTFVPYKIRPLNIRPLGTAALDMTPVSVTYSSPINSVLSEDLLFSYPLTPTGPIIDSYYDSVDNDIELRTKMTKYFYQKFFNNKLLYDYHKLLKYFKVKNNNVSKVSSKNEYNNNNLSHEEKITIVEFIINNYYDKYDLKDSLKKFIRKTRTKWFNLKDYKDDVFEVIFRDLKKKIKENY